MPLPWKKSKIGRVSRFVSDLKSSSKHGESLVVETGFPTSLIDLIVKNRDRFKKPSSKKKKSPLLLSSSSSLEISSLNSPPILTPPPRALSLPLRSLNQIPSSSNSISNSNSETMLMTPASPSSIEPIIKRHFCSSIEKVSSTRRPKKGFMFILKLFLILILALETKKIAIVITISTFLLLFVELAGKNLFSLIKPRSDSKECLNSMINNILLSNVSPEIDSNNLIEQEETVLGYNSGLDGDNNGAKIMADEVNMNAEIQIEPGFDSLHSGCRWGFVDSDQTVKTLSSSMNDEEQVIIDNANIKISKKKGSGKFNSNMLKKFVAKKLRGSKKRKNGLEESYLDSKNEKANMVEYQEEEVDDDQGLEERESKNDDDFEEDEDQVRSCSDFSQIELESDIGANVEVDEEGNAENITTSYLKQLIPFVIVLVGLIGGRIIALLLTISWYLLVSLFFRIAMRNKLD